MKLNLNNFRGPFKIGNNAVDVNRPIYDSQEEFIGTVTAPDDNTHGVKFAKDHADLFRASFELLENTVEVNEIANRTDISAEERLEAIRKLCARFV